MVYLIGGSSHCGKTLLAQHLMERYHIPYTSIDHLKMGFIRGGYTNLTPMDDDVLREFMWPFLVGMIRTALENEQTLLLEGCYIPEGWRDSFTEAENQRICAVFLTMSEDYLRNHFDLVCSKANAIEHRLDDHPNLERLIRCSDWFRTCCRRDGTPCIDVTDRFDLYELTGQTAALLGLEEHKRTIDR